MCRIGFSCLFPCVFLYIVLEQMSPGSRIVCARGCYDFGCQGTWQQCGSLLIRNFASSRWNSNVPKQTWTIGRLLQLNTPGCSKFKMSSPAPYVWSLADLLCRKGWYSYGGSAKVRKFTAGIIESIYDVNIQYLCQPNQLSKLRE